LASTTALTILFAPPAGAQVSGVSGGAFGFKASVSLFGGPPNAAGPLPTVTLPSSGATPAITATEQTTEAKFGPAVIFSSGPATASTEGSTGADGSAVSSVDIRNVNRSEQEVFTAERLQSSCRATTSGASGTTSMTGGVLRTSEGDPDAEGDDTNVNIPNNPAPNTEHQGNIEAVGDRFRIVFNEQIPQAGGITVNAFHMYLLGPTAVGDLIVGQSVCSTSGGGTTTTGGGGGATTTTLGGGSGGGSGGSGGSGSGGSGSGSGSGSGGSNMPKTGFDTIPLAVLGTEMVVGGVAAVVWGGRRRRWPRR
jgi:hypothetical protein